MGPSLVTPGVETLGEAASDAPLQFIANRNAYLFVHHKAVQIRAPAHRDLARVMKGEVPPLPGNQEGFLEGMLLVAPDKGEAFVITLWEEKQHDEKCSCEFYPEAMKTLRKCSEGVTEVRLFEEVEYSSFHKYAAVATF
jgi:hypothetical protein